MRRSSRDKHSFIQFYFDDWKAGTAHMTRLVRSIYFDICLYTWDKRRPVPPGALMMMLGDVENGAQIVNALVDEGVLVADVNGFVHSPRALREAERAFEAWEKKSRGGKIARGSADSDDSSKSDARVLQQSSHPRSTDSDSDSDTDSEPEEGGLDSRFAAQAVCDAWNEMARTCGLAQVIKITDERAKRLKARIAEHGVEAIIAGIRQIPDNDFLLGRTGEGGWKANFDWLLQPKSCAKLIEGGYDRGPGRSSGWTQD